MVKKTLSMMALQWLIILLTVVKSAALDQDVAVRNGNPAELKCNNTRLWTSISGNTAVIQDIKWISPEGIIYEGGNYSRINIALLPIHGVNNMLLRIGKVGDEHWGSYACLVTLTSGDLKAVVRGLNLDGQPARDLWALYKNNVILGASVGGGFFVLATLMCLVYHCSYHRRMERRAKKIGLNFDKENVEKENEAYEASEQL